MNQVFHGLGTELCAVAAQLTGTAYDDVERLARLLLALPQNSNGGTRSFSSGISNDGHPLQISASISQGRQAIRLLGDPAAFVTEPLPRFQKSLATVAALLEFRDREALLPIWRLAIEFILPTRRNQLASMGSGMIWVGGGILDNSLALYVNPRWDNESAQWDRAQRLVEVILPDSQQALGLIRRLRDFAALAAVAMEGTELADVRLKLYWRLNRPVTLSEMGSEMLDDPAMHDFLMCILEKRLISRMGLVISTAFSLSDGCLHDSKIDLCAHCVPQGPETWATLISKCAHKNELYQADLEGVLLEKRAEVAMIGMAIDSQQRKRLNVYLKPCAVQ